MYKGNFNKMFYRKNIIIVTEKYIFLLNLQELASENWKQSHEDIRHRQECERKQNKEKLYFFDIFYYLHFLKLTFGDRKDEDLNKNIP